MIRTVMSAAMLVLPLAGTARAAVPVDPSCALEGDRCSGAEAWTWSEVLAGRAANLDRYVQAHPGDSRVLRPSFVRALILTAGGIASVVAHGITLIGADICENADDKTSTQPDCLSLPVPGAAPHQGSAETTAAPLDLRDLRFGGAVALLRSNIHATVLLAGADFEHVLNLDRSLIEGDVDAERLRVEGGMTMVGAYVGGTIEADGLRSGATANFYAGHIAGSLHLRGAHIDGDLDLGNLHVRGPTRPAPDRPPHGSVDMPRSAIEIGNATVAGQLYASGAVVPNGHVDLGGIVVGGSVWMQAGTSLACVLRLERARIAGDLMLGGGHFSQVDLTAARIDRELRLESAQQETVWEGMSPAQYETCNGAVAADPLWLPSRLMLRNAQINAIRDKVGAWPSCLTLTGFTYTRPPQDLSGPRGANGTPRPAMRTCAPGDQGADVGQTERAGEPRSATWWCNWLARDPQRTGTAYTQLAAALEAVGSGDEADKIRFAERRFESGQTSNPIKSFLNFLAMIFVGFGIGVYTLIAMAWAILFVTVASLFLRLRLLDLQRARPDNMTINAALADKHIWWCLFASLQTMLPLITLSKAIDDFLHTPVLDGEPDTRPLYGNIALGFAGLAVAGLILSGFLLQGLRTSFGL